MRIFTVVDEGCVVRIPIISKSLSRNKYPILQSDKELITLSDSALAFQNTPALSDEKIFKPI